MAAEPAGGAAHGHLLFDDGGAGGGGGGGGGGGLFDDPPGGGGDVAVDGGASIGSEDSASVASDTGAAQGAAVATYNESITVEALSPLSDALADLYQGPLVDNMCSDMVLLANDEPDDAPVVPVVAAATSESAGEAAAGDGSAAAAASNGSKARDGAAGRGSSTGSSGSPGSDDSAVAGAHAAAGDGRRGGSTTPSMPASGTPFHVHRAILAARSPVFRAMLTGSFNEASRREFDGGRTVIPTNLPVDGVHTLLTFLYSGRAVVTAETILPVAAAADMYDVPELSNACGRLVSQKLPPKALLPMLRAATDAGMEFMVQRCLDRVAAEAEAFLDAPEATTLTYEQLASLVVRDALGATEVTVFRAVQRWCDANTATTKAQRDFLLKHVRYPLMSQADIATVVEPSGIVPNGLVFEALLHIARAASGITVDGGGIVSPGSTNALAGGWGGVGAGGGADSSGSGGGSGGSTGKEHGVGGGGGRGNGGADGVTGGDEDPLVRLRRTKRRPARAFGRVTVRMGFPVAACSTLDTAVNFAVALRIVFPADGFVRRIHFFLQRAAPAAFGFLALRKLQVGYRVVHAWPVRAHASLAVGVAHDFDVPDDAQDVRAGDMIGVYAQSSMPIPFDHKDRAAEAPADWRRAGIAASERVNWTSRGVPRPVELLFGGESPAVVTQGYLVDHVPWQDGASVLPFVAIGGANGQRAYAVAVEFDGPARDDIV